MSEPLKILLVSPEVVPFAKTGGLADVAGALPKAIEALGHDIRLVMPRYGRIRLERFALATEIPALPVPLDHGVVPAGVLRGRIGSNIPVYLVDAPSFFDREGIYGYPDDGERFVFFCRAALEMCRALGWSPDVIHCHDWHTGIIPNWLQTIHRDDPAFSGTATVFTIHNLQYQGIYGWRILEIAGIAEHGFVTHPDIEELDNVVDLMARGIAFADVVSTVSERYAQEIRTPEYGERLDPLLRDRSDRLFGILNGIDQEEYDPTRDPHIYQKFGINSLDQRVENKLALQQEANVPERPDVPLIGMISRLTDQKGFDLLEQILPHIMKLDVQFVLLGTGDQHYHEVLSRLARQYAGKLAVFLTFNTRLARRIYAGSDMFLMPSRFEPCGLGQMVALRYGSIPVVRSTGGLADTVVDFDPSRGQGQGFTFADHDPWMLFAALVRAIETYRHRPIWRTLQHRGMERDFSWAASAEKYVDLNRLAIDFRRGARG